VIVLDQPVEARYLKVKSYFDDRDTEFNPVNLAQFVNEAEDIIKVYYYVENRYEQYSYDEVGNRTNEVITQRYAVERGYEYYPNSNLLKSNGKYGFEYDDNGNLIRKGRGYTLAEDGSIIFDQEEYWEYEYDLLNRLVKFSKNNQVVAEYVYDEAGLRIKKESPVKTTYYVFTQSGNLLYEQKNDKYLEYIYVAGKHFARIDRNLNSGETKKYFYHTDYLGSRVLVTNADGETV
jgi:YD repeat-containing protein